MSVVGVRPGQFAQLGALASDRLVRAYGLTPGDFADPAGDFLLSPDGWEARFDRLLLRLVEMHAEQSAAGHDDWIWRIGPDWGISPKSTLLGHSVLVDSTLPLRSVMVIRPNDAQTMPRDEFRAAFGVDPG